MSNVVNDFTFQVYNSSLGYEKHDVVYGVNATDTNFYYATQDTSYSSTRMGPRAGLSYTAVSWQRSEDLTTVFFNKTGTQPDFTIGSHIIVISQNADQPAINYSGLCIDGGSNYVSYLNPGWPQGNTALAASARVSTVLSPAWSTGFFWAPSNTTNVEFTTKRDFAQFGDGYTQQGRLGINSIGSVINLSFENRSYKESRAILNFVQSAGGVQPTLINLPVNRLFNNPFTTYLLTDPKINMKSYNINDISVTATRIYNPIG